MNINFDVFKALCMTNQLNQEKYMFDKLFDLTMSSTSGKSSLEILTETICSIQEVLQHCVDHYSHDHNTYDSAIDAICQILQEHKSKKIP